jgi:Ca2+-binding RTX toxin-like protein
MPDQTGTAGNDILVGNGTDDTLYGLDGNDWLFGRAGADTLYGGNGNDDLYGEGGLDRMYGGSGDDNYFVDDTNMFNDGRPGDIVWEAAGEGRDTVYTSVNYSLYNLPNDGGEIENLGALDRSATTPLSLFGNNLDNEIWGNAGDNDLYGYGGHDILRGGPGNDTYEYPNGDQIIEEPGEGYDTVVSQFSVTLPDNVEELRFGGSGGTLVGNALDNVFVNTDPSSRQTLVIDGGLGADHMQGASGINIFFVDNPGDVVAPPFYLNDHNFPFSYTVFSTIDFAPPAWVWRVVATAQSDTTPLSFTGNGLDNELTGNDGDNVLDGGAGADVLIGYGGADTFCYTSPIGPKNIDQFVTFEPGVDKIALGATVFSGLSAGPLDPGAFHTGATAADADDRIMYDPATGSLFFDPDGSGSASAHQFGVMHEGLGVTAGDFIII